MEELQKRMVENYIWSYNAFDVDGMTRDLHHEVVFENISNEKVDLTIRGIEAFKEQAENAIGYFTQRVQRVTSWDFKDNIVTVNIDYRGILAVDLPNGKKAGDTLQLKGLTIFSFKEGQIAKIQDKS